MLRTYIYAHGIQTMLLYTLYMKMFAILLLESCIDWVNLG